MSTITVEYAGIEWTCTYTSTLDGLEDFSIMHGEDCMDDVLSTSATNAIIDLFDKELAAQRQQALEDRAEDRAFWKAEGY